MGKTKIFNKLVRDRIPEIISKTGAKVEIKILDSEEYIKYLGEKLLEECKEVLESKNEKEITEELADVLEVIYAISDVFKIDIAEIENVRISKKETRGGFSSKIFLKSVVE